MLSILKASAGSGKTFALTYEYIKMLLGRKDDSGRYRLNKRASDRHRSILAITFTNKATDEMKQRIVQELAVLAGRDDSESPYMKKLTDCFGCSPQEVSAEAERALRQLLFDFNFFHISTIDSFFQLILRTFAYEAEIEGDYEVQLDSKQVIAQAADELLSSLNTAPKDDKDARQIAGWITSYLLDRLSEGKAVALFNRSSKDFEDFVNIIGHLSDEVFQTRFDEMMKYFHVSRISDFAEAVKEGAKKHIEKTKQSVLAALDGYYANPLPKGKLSGNVENPLRKFVNEGSFPGSNSVTLPNVVSGESHPFTAPGQKICEQEDREYQVQALRQACQAVLDARSVAKCCDGLLHNIFVLGLFHSVYQQIEKQRTSEGLLLLSDTNSLLRKIIGDDDAPFVFERVGVNLRHFLIDEFQDTSHLQWKNLRPLVNESQGSGHDNLIIGDEKQCIYRFRGSAPDLLRTQVENEVVPPVMVSGNTVAENTNWRSAPAVVEANNALFASVAAAYNYTDIYSNVHQQIADRNKNLGGYVSIRKFSDMEASEYQENALKRMLDNIDRQLQSGYRGCDIAVLVRESVDGEKVIAALLDAFDNDDRFAGKGLRVVSDDSLLVESAPAVRRVIAVLRAMASASNHDMSNEASHGHYHTSAELTNLINCYEQLLGSGSTPSEALAGAVNAGGEPVEPPIDLSKIHCVNLPSLVERIVAHYFPGGTVPEGELMYILALEDIVADYCATNNADIQSFLRWWDSTGHKSMVAGTADESALRVLTIHKSKGLEFPCVHIPLLYKDLVKFNSAEWFAPEPLVKMLGINSEQVPPLVPLRPSEWMENTVLDEQYTAKRSEALLDAINVLYVAFTRAVNELIVSYYFSLPKKNAEEKVAKRPSAGQLLERALSRIDLSGEEAVWGSPTTAPKAEKKRRKITDPSEFFDMPPYLVDERDELWNSTRIDTDTDDRMSRRHGIELHNILANVAVRADIKRAVVEAVNCGVVKADDCDDIIARLEKAFAQTPEAARWFDPRAKALRERSIVTPKGDVLRPDRVVLNPDGSIDVVDYKFGAEHRKSHLDQVEDYVAMLRQMGHEQVSGYVWYVGEAFVVKL